MACVITISYQLAAHLPIYYFYNLRVSLTINVIHLCVVCGQVFPLPFIHSSRIRSRFLYLLFVAFFFVLVCSMGDCSCGCLVKMARIADGCVYESGLELTQTQRRGQLSCLLYDNHGFRTPYVCRLTDGDLKESWVCVSIRFVFYFLVGFCLKPMDWICSFVL